MGSEWKKPRIVLRGFFISVFIIAGGGNCYATCNVLAIMDLGGLCG